MHRKKAITKEEIIWKKIENLLAKKKNTLEKLGTLLLQEDVRKTLKKAMDDVVFREIALTSARQEIVDKIVDFFKNSPNSFFMRVLYNAADRVQNEQQQSDNELSECPFFQNTTWNILSSALSPSIERPAKKARIAEGTTELDELVDTKKEAEPLEVKQNLTKNQRRKQRIREEKVAASAEESAASVAEGGLFGLSQAKVTANFAASSLQNDGVQKVDSTPQAMRN